MNDAHHENFHALEAMGDTPGSDVCGCTRVMLRERGNEQRGLVEIRWQGDDPDDVVAPWPRSKDGTPISIHVERMDDGHVWMNIYGPDTDVHMWFHARRKNELEWTVQA